MKQYRRGKIEIKIYYLSWRTPEHNYTEFHYRHLNKKDVEQRLQIILEKIKEMEELCKKRQQLPHWLIELACNTMNTKSAVQQDLQNQEGEKGMLVDICDITESTSFPPDLWVDIDYWEQPLLCKWIDIYNQVTPRKVSNSGNRQKNIDYFIVEILKIKERKKQINMKEFTAQQNRWYKWKDWSIKTKLKNAKTIKPSEKLAARYNATQYMTKLNTPSIGRSPSMKDKHDRSEESHRKKHEKSHASKHSRNSTTERKSRSRQSSRSRRKKRRSKSKKRSGTRERSKEAKSRSRSYDKKRRHKKQNKTYDTDNSEESPRQSSYRKDIYKKKKRRKRSRRREKSKNRSRTPLYYRTKRNSLTNYFRTDSTSTQKSFKSSGSPRNNKASSRTNKYDRLWENSRSRSVSKKRQNSNVETVLDSTLEPKRRRKGVNIYDYETFNAAHMDIKKAYEYIRREQTRNPEKAERFKAVMTQNLREQRQTVEEFTVFKYLHSERKIEEWGERKLVPATWDVRGEELEKGIKIYEKVSFLDRMYTGTSKDIKKTRKPVKLQNKAIERLRKYAHHLYKNEKTSQNNPPHIIDHLISAGTNARLAMASEVGHEALECWAAENVDTTNMTIKLVNEKLKAEQKLEDLLDETESKRNKKTTEEKIVNLIKKIKNLAKTMKKERRKMTERLAQLKINLRGYLKNIKRTTTIRIYFHLKAGT